MAEYIFMSMLVAGYKCKNIIMSTVLIKQIYYK